MFVLFFVLSQFTVRNLIMRICNQNGEQTPVWKEPQGGGCCFFKTVLWASNTSSCVTWSTTQEKLRANTDPVFLSSYCWLCVIKSFVVLQWLCASHRACHYSRLCPEVVFKPPSSQIVRCYFVYQQRVRSPHSGEFQKKTSGGRDVLPAFRKHFYFNSPQYLFFNWHHYQDSKQTQNDLDSW